MKPAMVAMEIEIRNWQTQNYLTIDLSTYLAEVIPIHVTTLPVIIKS